MGELAKQESELQTAILLGMSLEQVLSVLNSRKIGAYEFTEPSDGVVLQDRDATITARSGEMVVTSRFQTGAFESSCAYDMQIVLLFGNDHRLKERCIRRFPMCP
jgi:hypothetical protein